MQRTTSFQHSLYFFWYFYGKRAWGLGGLS